MCREPAQAELGAGALHHSVSHYEVSISVVCSAALTRLYFTCECSSHLVLSSQFYVSVGDCRGIPGGSEHMGTFQETCVCGI